MYSITIITHMQISLLLYMTQRNAAPYSYAAYCLIMILLEHNSLYFHILELNLN